MSYDDTDRSDLNKAREALGDTSNDPTTEHFTDDHIEAVLAEKGYNAGLASLASEYAAWAAQQPDRVSLPGGLSVSWAARVAELRRLAAEMQALAAQEATVTTAARVSHAARNIAAW
jgi:hypothetical protein